MPLSSPIRPEQNAARERVLERPLELEPDRGGRSRRVAAEQRESPEGFVRQRSRHAHLGDPPLGGSDERAPILAAVERQRASGETATLIPIVCRLRVQGGTGRMETHSDLDRTVIGSAVPVSAALDVILSAAELPVSLVKATM